MFLLSEYLKKYIANDTYDQCPTNETNPKIKIISRTIY